MDVKSVWDIGYHSCAPKVPQFRPVFYNHSNLRFSMKTKDRQISDEIVEAAKNAVSEIVQINKEFAEVFPTVDATGGETTTAHLLLNNQQHGKEYPYQYQCGDRLKLCLATDKKEAMKIFQTHDVNRVNRYRLDQFFLVNVFQPHEIEAVSGSEKIILNFPLR